jgi:hypothetical protein
MFFHVLKRSLVKVYMRNTEDLNHIQDSYASF